MKLLEVVLNASGSSTKITAMNEHEIHSTTTISALLLLTDISIWLGVYSLFQAGQMNLPPAL